MKIGEKILSYFSRYKPLSQGCELGNALDTLVSSFGKGFYDLIRDKAILDHGCGVGLQVVAMALAGAKFVVGVDIRGKILQKGIELAQELNLNNKVLFFTDLDGSSFLGFFDLIISQNSFEHYGEPEDIVKMWYRLLKPNGKIYMTFGPPWYAPYGAHMHFFTKIPWVQIIFSEESVMRARSRFRQDGARRYRDVEGGLNQITVRRFEKIIRESNFLVEYTKYVPVKGLFTLTKLPFIREFFINRIDCILKKA